MLNKFIALFVFLFLFIANARAQSITIKGVVYEVDTNKKMIPLQGALIRLYDSKNKQLKIMTTEKSGVYQFLVEKAGSYSLKAQAIGFSSWQSAAFSLESNTARIDTVLLQSKIIELDEVIVEEKKKRFTRKLDKLIYSVENDPDKKTSTTYDMLDKLPLVQVRDNRILMRGAGVQILVDGKRSILFNGNAADALKNLPAELLKQIELIKNPSAKYDAEGSGGIINIVTKRQKLEGYIGSLRLTANSNSTFANSADITAKTKKLGISANIEHATQQNAPSDYGKIHRENYATAGTLDQTSYGKTSYTYPAVSLRVTYEIDSLNLISANGNLYSQNIENLSQINSFIKEPAYNSSIQSNNNDKSEASGSKFSMDYQHNFRTKYKSNMVFSFDYNKSNEDITSDYRKDITNSANAENQKVLQLNTQQEKTYQFDYYNNLFGKGELEVGIKGIFRKNASDYSFSVLDNSTGNYLRDPLLSNSYSQRQNVNAFYVSYGHEFKHFSIKAGLRGEHTSVDANFYTTASKLNTNYMNLVPSFFLSKELSKNHSLTFGYSNRITRPGLFHLNPFINFSNPLNLIYGNPNLKPERAHSFDMDYTFDNDEWFIMLSPYFRHIGNAITRTYSIRDSITNITYNNIGRSDFSGISLDAEKAINKYRFSLKSSLNYSSFDDLITARSGWWYNGSVSVNRAFKNTMRFSLSLSYTSEMPTIQGSRQELYGTYFMVSKDFFKRKLNASLVAKQLIPREFKQYDEVNGADFYQYNQSSYNQQEFLFVVRYGFGKLRDRIKRTKKTIINSDVKEAEPKKQQQN